VLEDVHVAAGHRPGFRRRGRDELPDVRLHTRRFPRLLQLLLQNTAEVVLGVAPDVGPGGLQVDVVLAAAVEATAARGAAPEEGSQKTKSEPLSVHTEYCHRGILGLVGNPHQPHKAFL